MKNALPIPEVTGSASRTDQQAEIGLLLVHGIGEQKEEEARSASFIDGLKLVFGESITHKQPPNTVSLEGRSIRLYEVYWADLLDRERVPAVRDSFHIEELFPLPWFPWLHLKDGLYPANSYSRRSVFWRWLVLLLAIGGLFPVWIVASLLQGVFFIVHALLLLCGLLRGRGRNYLGHVLDGYLGDVFNYVKSAGLVLTQDSPLYDVAGQIQALFHRQLTQACQECSEVQILAHSLGTLVTYHGITGYNLRSDNPATGAVPHTVEPLSQLTRIYTIGCPLEKIRFVWPSLITEDLNGLVAAGSAPSNRSGEGPQCRFRWDNFYNPFDIVAGKLKTFNHWGQVSNHTMYQSGLATAHLVYEKNPVFLSVIGQGLSGKQCPPTRPPVATRVRDFLRGFIETMALPAILILLVALGWIFILLTFWLIGFLFHGPVRIVLFVVLTALFLVGLFIAPWDKAKKEHKAHWGKEAQSARTDAVPARPD